MKDTEQYPQDGPDQLIEHPPHYTSGKMETWDWMELGMTDEEFRGYLKGNVFKYLKRYQLKGGIQDLNKAAAYIQRLRRFESKDAKTISTPADFRQAEDRVCGPQKMP